MTRRSNIILNDASNFVAGTFLHMSGNVIRLTGNAHVVNIDNKGTIYNNLRFYCLFRYLWAYPGKGERRIWFPIK